MSEADLKEFERELNKRIAQIVGEVKHSRPEFNSYECKAEIWAYKKTPRRGCFGHSDRLIQAFLNDEALLNMTNDKIVESIAAWCDGYRPSSGIMTRRIELSARRIIQALFDSVGLGIVVRPDDTLSKLKIAIRENRAGKGSN